MPQMRGLGDMPVVSAVVAMPKRKVKAVGQGLHAVPSWRAAIYAVGLIAAFALGYLTAIWGV